MPRALPWTIVATLVSATVAGSLAAHDPRRPSREIAFPDVAGAVTLVADLHTHSVFSDGVVWPTVRIQEAVRDGLDAIAITEHLEHQPHADDIPHPDRNRAYRLALERAATDDPELLVIHGSELTRSMPPGHANAIFLEDSNPLLTPDALDVFAEAERQGAFVFWNHPHWVGQRRDGVARVEPLHRRLIEEGKIHGIEVVNHSSYSEEALAIALEHDLTILGTSDVHGLVDWSWRVPEGGHRPVTLVFAAERSLEALRTALFEGRTVAWFEELLVGREEHLVPLLESSLELTAAAYTEDDDILRLRLTNHSSAAYVLRDRGDLSFQNAGDVLTVAPLVTRELEVRTVNRRRRIEISFEVLNAVTAPRSHPTVRLAADIDGWPPPEDR